MNDARPDRRPVAGRALLVVGGLAAIVGVGLAAAAVRPAGSDDRVVLDVATVTAPAVPDTIAPDPDFVTEPGGGLGDDTRDGGAGTAVPDTIAPDPDFVTEPGGGLGDDTPGGDADAAADPAPPTTAGEQLSPLADLLGVPGSAIPPTIEPRVQPASVTIDAIELRGPVRAVGLEDDGELEVPDETEIGWYRYGSSPGRAGATVLAAHVTWNGTTGPFFELGRLDPGAEIELALDSGSSRTYEVIERTMYDKDSLPRELIWRTTGDETLVLITCGGSFNPDINRYRQNIVVYAVPVRAGPGRATS